MTWSDAHSLVEHRNGKDHPADVRRPDAGRGSPLRFRKEDRHRLPGESGGIVTGRPRVVSSTQTSVAMGHEIAVTPVQMVRAFSAFAVTAPMQGPLSPRLTPQSRTVCAPAIVRVVSPRIADLTRQTMRASP